MRSRIYTGKIMHARSKPVKHKFSYPIYFYSFDLDEIDRLDREVMFFGHNRFCPVSLHDADYLTPGREPLKLKLQNILEKAGHSPHIGKVDLITSARVMHYVFNPVSFFFCSSLDESPDKIVVQVNNTFGEMHIYVLADLLPARRPGEDHYKAKKVFHVSPFFDRIGTYDFYFKHPGHGNLDIVIQHKEEDEVVFAARLTGRPRTLGKWSVAGKILLHPLTASLTMPRILWQAARLRFQKHLPVFHKPPPKSPMTIRPAPPGLAQRLCRQVCRSMLKGIEKVRLHLHYPEGHSEEFGKSQERSADIRIVDNTFFRRTLFKGDIGLGEAYVAGEWTAEDLPGTLTLLSENMEHLKEKHHTLSSIGRACDYTRHLLRSNTPAGSRRNIDHHYNLSNKFFSLFLDPTMTYSCGIYPGPDATLQQAQQNKLRSVIKKAGIDESHHVLEIGCGWGSFAIEAARSTGCRVTGITISSKQLELAREKVLQAGLQDKVTLELLDYRNIEGTWDRIVSIEMLEAVGHANLGNWFRMCSRSLKPGGKALIQVITIPHERYGYYTRSSDWIRKHIFPGGHLPSREVMEKAVRKHTDLLFAGVEGIGHHYAKTLRDWSRNLQEKNEGALTLGFDEAFLRKWHYYFAYCEAGFETGIIDNLQIILQKPDGEAAA